MPPILQPVLLPSLAKTQHGLALPVQLVMEIVQQCSPCSPLEEIHIHNSYSAALGFVIMVVQWTMLRGY